MQTESETILLKTPIFEHSTRRSDRKGDLGWSVTEAISNQLSDKAGSLGSLRYNDALKTDTTALSNSLF